MSAEETTERAMTVRTESMQIERVFTRSGTRYAAVLVDSEPTDLRVPKGRRGCEWMEMPTDARARMIELGHLRQFVADNRADLLAYCEVREYDPSQGPVESYAGHDLWLTRRGHGCGFWDRGLGALGDRLTAYAEGMGDPDDHTPYVCADGTVTA